MKVAIVHYWLVNMRGGEKVLEALCAMYPQADIFTHVVDYDALSAPLRTHAIYTSFIQRLPWSKRLYRHYLPLMPFALEQLDLSAYDLVISSESGPAKGVLTRADTLHVCYCHSPMRYLWDFYQQYLASMSWPVRNVMRLLATPLRQWDVLSANRVDYFIANSHTVARRIRKHWRREAAVVYPPVDMGAEEVSASPREDFYLCFGELVSYKAVHLAVEACTALHKRLVIAGDGPCRKELEAIAGPTVRFMGRVDTRQKTHLYATCKALLFPGEEDFGIVPVEAMLYGTPVIAYARGGATETVREMVTGLLFAQQTTQCLRDTIERFEQMQESFDPQQIRAHAQTFSRERFTRAMEEHIAKARAQIT